MLATRVDVVAALLIAAEAADGHDSLSLEQHTPWFIRGFWLAACSMLAMVAFHLGRWFIAHRRERRRPW
jgi:uncharacterized membrane protein